MVPRQSVTLAASHITEEEIDELADFLDGVDTAMNIERLDGFFSALIVGPATVSPSEYWPLILGEEPTRSEAFSSQKHFERIFSLAVKSWNTIVDTLQAGDIYSPVFLTDDEGHLRGNDWAKGFMQGVELRADGWAEVFADQELSEAIVPMVALARENDPGDSRRFKLPAPPSRRDFLSAMALGMRVLHEHFLKQRAEEPPVSQPPVVRASPKVSRNDPCPCGSGRKFKQCCLAKMH